LVINCDKAAIMHGIKHKQTNSRPGEKLSRHMKAHHRGELCLQSASKRRSKQKHKKCSVKTAKCVNPKKMTRETEIVKGGQ